MRPISPIEVRVLRIMASHIGLCLAATIALAFGVTTVSDAQTTKGGKGTTATSQPAKTPAQQRPNWYNIPEDRFVPAWAPDKAVAKVNGEAITAREVTTFLWDWRAADVVNTLMIFKLIDQEANRQKIRVTRADVLAKMDETLADLKPLVPAGRTLEQELLARNTAWTRLYIQIRATIQLDRIIEQSLKRDDLVSTAQIIIRVPGNTPEEQEKNKAATLEAAQKVVEEIRGGLSWDEAVEKYSEDPFTKGKGGDLGWRWKEELDPKFAEAVLGKNVGAVTDPIETPSGYQIVRLVKTGQQATPEEYKTAVDRITEMKRGMIVRELQDKAKMENYIVPVVPPGAMTPRQPQPSPEGNRPPR